MERGKPHERETQTLVGAPFEGNSTDKGVSLAYRQMIISKVNTFMTKHGLQ